MATNHIPQSLALALMEHEGELREGPEDDGRLASAIRRHIWSREADGLSVATIRGTVSYPGAAILRHTRPGIALAEMNASTLRRFVLSALEIGYSGRTIKGKHLQLVRTLLRHACLPDPTGEVKRSMASALAGRYTPPPRITAVEFASIFRRIERFPGLLRKRHRDLAVIRLLSLRAVRTGELSRVLIERDVRLSVPCLDIVDPKVRALPRRIELSAQLAHDVRRLVGDRERGPLIDGGERRLNQILETWKKRLAEPRLNQRHLRRSCASDLAAQGAPLPVIREVLGHVHGSPLTARYLIGDQEMVREHLRHFEHQTRPFPNRDLIGSTPQ